MNLSNSTLFEAIDDDYTDVDLITPPRQDADIIDIRGLLAALRSLDDDDDTTGRPNTDWQEDALCAQADPEAFFPEKGGSTRAAKSICGRCPAKEACLQYALDNDERHGIWGGLSEPERRELRRTERDLDRRVG